MVLYLSVLSLIQMGTQEEAAKVIEKEMDKKNPMDLVNNPKTYAILYRLTQIEVEKKRTAKLLTKEDEKESKLQLEKFARKCNEKNSKRDPYYAEILIHWLIESGTPDEVTAFIIKNKYNISEFTFTIPKIIPKIQAKKERGPLLKVSINKFSYYISFPLEKKFAGAL